MQILFCAPNAEIARTIREELGMETKTFLWHLSEEEQPGDSDVFLHDLVFLIDRQSCVARSTGKISGGKFQN